MTLTAPPFGKIFGVIYGMSLKTYTSNLKSVALTILDGFAFNGQKFTGSRDPGHAPFWKDFKASCTDCHWKHACQI